MKQFMLRNGDTMVIRKAAGSDAASLLEYVEAISGESDNLTFGPGEFGISVESEAQFLDNLSGRSNAIYVVAEVGGRIVGSLSFSGGGRPRIAHTGEFGVSVLKEYWGKGVGTELIKFLIEWAKQSGIIRKINLRVRTDNTAAINLYRKLGFAEAGVVTREFQIGGRFYDSLLMGLEID